MGLLTSTDNISIWRQHHKFQLCFICLSVICVSQVFMRLHSTTNMTKGKITYKGFHISLTGRWMGKTDLKFSCTLSSPKQPSCQSETLVHIFIRKFTVLESCRPTDCHLLPLTKAQNVIYLVPNEPHNRLYTVVARFSECSFSFSFVSLFSSNVT